MDRGAWLAPVPRLSESDMTEPLGSNADYELDEFISLHVGM